jgi:multidrug resistance efflux pump
MMASIVPPPTRRSWWWLLAVPVLAVGLAWAGHVFTVSPQAVTTTTAAPLTVRPVIAFGYVDLQDGVRSLHPTVPGGRVTEVLVKEGESVPAGAVLLRLDDTQARKKVEEAKAAVDEAKAALHRGQTLPEQHLIKLGQAQSAIEAAEAQRNAAKLGLDRKQELVRIGQLNPQDLAIAREELQAAKKALEIKQDDLRQLRLLDPKTEMRVLETQVSRAEALLAQAEAGLKEYALTAPVAGVVLRISLGAGDVASPATAPAVLFSAEGPRIVRAEIEQAFAAFVAVGQQVTIEDDTHAAGRWTGRVQRVADWFTQQRPVLQQDPSQYTDVRTMQCIIELDPDQPRLRINQRVRVTIEVPVN